MSIRKARKTLISHFKRDKGFSTLVAEHLCANDLAAWINTQRIGSGESILTRRWMPHRLKKSKIPHRYEALIRDSSYRLEIGAGIWTS